jgi:nucleoside-diphosphate-sugar epimerase
MAQGLIALTGATGFVGRYVVEELVRQKIPVRVLVRSPEKNRQLEGVEICRGSLEEPQALASLVEGATTIIHCAGAIKAKNLDHFNEVNVAGMKRVIRACGQAKIKRFVHISTMAAREPRISDYAASKRQGEHVLHRHGQDMKWIIIRPPVVYGPRDKATLPLLKMFLGKFAFIPGNPNSRISLIFVEDLARAIVMAATAKKIKSEMTHELHDGVHEGYSWKELARLAGENTGHKVRCFFLPKALVELVAIIISTLSGVVGRVPVVTQQKIHEIYHPDWVAKHFLFEESFKWSARTTFRDGFSKTVDWYRKEKWI